MKLLLFRCGSLPSEQLLHKHVMSTQGSSCTHMYLWSGRWLAHVFLPRKQLLHKCACGSSCQCVLLRGKQFLHTCATMFVTVSAHECA